MVLVWTSRLDRVDGVTRKGAGNKLLRGVPYYVLPLFSGSGGGLTLSRTTIDSCPLDVTQEPFDLSKGVPFTITSNVFDEDYVREAYPVTIEADVTDPCRGSNIMKVTSNETKGFKSATIGGESNKPESCFQLVEADMMPGLRSYQIQLCPFKCGTNTSTRLEVDQLHDLRLLISIKDVSHLLRQPLSSCVDLGLIGRTWKMSGSGDFSVASVRQMIDDKILPEAHKTRWVRYVPIKVNVIAWKVKSDSLPTRFSISRRGQIVGLISRWWGCVFMGSLDSSMSSGWLMLGNGENTRFWVDNWYEGGVIKELFPRMFALELNKNATVSSKLNASSLDNSFRRKARSGIEEMQLNSLAEISRMTTLVPCEDRYVWTLESDGVFSVASIRKEIDGNRFQDVSLPTRWVKSVPIKVNIIAWKVKSNALPTRFNISRRGMDIDSIVCPICNAGVESTNHIFFQCVVVRQIMRKISSWWNIDYLDVNAYEE
ncbi:RNA-directed DNA polymerase, eukaryota [Tanacetum coccineum]|uniref:RNA-directed DNA polymerase, eukaryota n=1 Tax=Tanacetum coccineum TaxID=301880 RepID=A0ABQ5B9X2_9ASTR